MFQAQMEAAHVGVAKERSISASPPVNCAAEAASLATFIDPLTIDFPIAAGRWRC